MLGLAFFLFVFDFARSPTDAKPPDEGFAGVVGVRRATRSAVKSTTAGYCRSCALQDVMHVHGSARL